MAETEKWGSEETAPVKIKQRPIVRLGIFLISHSLVFSVICLVAGVLTLFLLPVLAKNTYISENALMPGSAHSMLSNRDVSDGSKLVNDITNLRLKHEGRGVEVQRLIAKYISELGAEVSYQKFHPEANQFHPLRFFSGPSSHTVQQNFSCSSYGVNVVGIIRAPRGDGKEAIVLVTPYDSANGDKDEGLSLGILYSVFALLTRVNWLAKDIVWLVADSRYGDYASVAAWLRDYYTPSFRSLDVQHCGELETSDNFIRAGTMAAALVLKVGDRSEQFEDTVSIYAEASNGQMPNLDLINVVNYLAVHRQGMHVKVEKVLSLLASTWLKSLGGIFEVIAKVARSISPDLKFGIPTSDYSEGAATLASSLYYQALGIPTGPHGAFRDYQVDAITLKISPRFFPDTKSRQHDFFLRGGRLIEGTIRSVNNLLEKFHQSFFLYLLTSPGKFVSVGVYMIALALLVAPLPIVAAFLYMDADNQGSGSKDDKSAHSKAISGSELDRTLKSWKWLNAAKQVFAVHLWGAIVSLLPHFICQIPGHTPTNYFALWVFSSALILVVMFMIPGSPFSLSHASQLQKRDWAILKAVTISTIFIGLCLMSIINFATAEIGALLIVPMCLMARPLKLDIRAGSLKSLLRLICNLALVLVGCPPIAYLVSKGVIVGFDSINVGDFWNWVESLWIWKSATCLYIGMVHLPCWALCILILSHPC